MVFKGDKLSALLPANKVGNILYSHQGLSYGGLILEFNQKFGSVIDIFYKILTFLEFKGIEFLQIKEMPFVYLKKPSGELSFMADLLKANIVERYLHSVLCTDNKKMYSKSRLEGEKRGVKHGLVVKEEGDFKTFWNNILIPNLVEKHNAKPVHSLNEITMLKKKFPKNLRQFNVFYENKIVAGATIFESDKVAKLQYISGDKNKNTLGSLDFLQLHLINNVYPQKKYFDLGTSKGNDDNTINKGLLFWKEGFGAGTVTSDVFIIETKNYKLLENVMQ